MFKNLGLALLLITHMSVVKAQYISEVLEYKPAPGQFINAAPWGIPESANSIVGGVTGSMSLGTFGGYVVFTFNNPVENHPDNPFGVDFTIFGNPLSEWSEQGIVEVMKDENSNGLPDDIWYELAGSDYFFSTTIKQYEVTYTNPQTDVATDVPWVDNQGNTGLVLKNSYHNQPYYPVIDSFPAINNVQYTLSGTQIQDAVDRTVSTYIKSYRKPFGYVDNQLRGSAPYILPDNPYTPESENSGGDAFDISWAVDEYGNYVDLDEIHFVRVHNAVFADAGWLGEVSTEITGAVDVEPNNAVSGILDMIVIKDLPSTIRESEFQIEAFVYNAGRWIQNETINWEASMQNVSIDENNILSFSELGELTLTASIVGKPEITVSVTVILSDESTSVASPFSSNISCVISPNPASDFIQIKGVNNVSVYIYNITGSMVMKLENYTSNRAIHIADLPKGIFTIHIHGQEINTNLRLIKE